MSCRADSALPFFVVRGPGYEGGPGFNPQRESIDIVAEQHRDVNAKVKGLIGDIQ